MIIIKSTRLIIFSVGAVGYGVIEILWRGFTHWSMLIAGGVSFLALSEIEERFKRLTLFVKALFGGFIITAVEFIFGVIFNLILKMRVWDYSDMPLNIKGQVCPLFTVLWVGLSAVFIPLSRYIKRILSRRSEPF